MQHTSDQSGRRRLRHYLIMTTHTPNQVNLVQRPSHERKPVRGSGLRPWHANGKEGHV
jgi:hypothetical protein